MDFVTMALSNRNSSYMQLYSHFTYLQGLNVKSKVPELLETLDNCDLDGLLQFFEAT